MASDPSGPPGDRRGGPLSSSPRDRILPQVTPLEGWTRDWHDAIIKLSKMVVERHCNADPHALGQRLAPLLTITFEMVEVGQPGGKKPATFIRDQIADLRNMPPRDAVKTLEHPHWVLRRYLDRILEVQNAEIYLSLDPDLGLKERAAKRYALVLAPDHVVLPQPRRGTENPWAYVAELVAELLADVTGKEPKRSRDSYAEADTGWPLEFFRYFAKLAVAPAKPPILEKVWRNALDARKKRKTAI